MTSGRRPPAGPDEARRRRDEATATGTALPVVVGLDDSPASRAALRWAAGYAAATGAAVRAVHVLEWPIGLTAAAMGLGTRLRVPRHEVAESYGRGMQQVFSEVASPAGSELRFAQGDVAEVLVALAGQAGLLVVGTRESTADRRYLRGSVSHYCVGYAGCPVVTVPATGDSGGYQRAELGSTRDHGGAFAWR